MKRYQVDTTVDMLRWYCNKINAAATDAERSVHLKDCSEYLESKADEFRRYARSEAAKIPEAVAI